MPRFHLQTTLPAVPATVFELLRDFRLASRWQSSIREVRVFPDAPVQMGSVVIERRRLGSYELELSYKVIELTPSESIRIESTDGPVRYQVEQRLRPVPGGTELSVHLALELPGALRLAAGLMAPTIRREAEADLERLGRLFIEHAD